MSTFDEKGKIIRLNVGGTRYDVSRDTLERCEGSMLASLISKHWKEGNADDSEPIFIDRNGRLFEYVLDYLRSSKVYLPSCTRREAVKAEFEFYGIDVDMSKVTENFGIEHAHSLTAKIQAAQKCLEELRAKQLSIQIAALAEHHVMKHNSPTAVRVYLSYDEFHLAGSYLEFVQEGLLDRGMEYVEKFCFKTDSCGIMVKKASED
jgi:hypothetical protein